MNTGGGPGISEPEHRLEELRGELRERESDLSDLRQRLEERERELSEARGQLERQSRDVRLLTEWFERLEHLTSALLDSRRWKAASLLGNLARRLLLKSPSPTAVDAIEDVDGQFRAWKKDRVEPPGKGGRPGLRRGSSGELPAGTLAGEAGPETGERTKVSVLAWDLGHNPMGRAHLLAEALSRKFDVEIVGANFPHHGTEVWGPVRDGEIPVVDFTGQDFPAHFAEMERLAREIDGDVILVSKPRLPSYELGILAKQFKNRPLILDVDDYELSFFREHDALTLEGVGELRQDGEFLAPYANLWTRYCDGLIPLADGLTVSNAELQKRYGGEIVPHARDEKTFDPALYDRDAIRASFGFTPEDRVILFVGTPRSHKGVADIAEALENIGDPRYKLCIIGTAKDRNLRERLERLGGDHVRLFDDQPYGDLPANLAVGDLVCLLQDPESEISKYQMPAKFTDALAMGIPMLATDAPPLKNLASEGLVEPLGDVSLQQKIEEIFSNYAEFKEKAARNRDVFLAEYSYAAAAEKLEDVILPLLHDPPPVPKEFKRLVRFHRQLFSSPQISPVEKPEEVDAEPGSGYADDSYDIVFFWKQNDTGIYGRRQDMLVKYLARSPRVNRIVHFDAPIDSNTLFSLPKREGDDETDQSNLVFHQTISRLLGQKDSEKVKHYTFVGDSGTSGNGRRGSHGQGDHLQYIADVLQENNVGARRTIFWVCPVTKFDFHEVVAAFGPDLVVADVIDDQRTFKEPGSPRRAANERNYQQVLGLSDVTLANCEPVRQSMLEYADDVHFVPNALEMPGAVAGDGEPPEELQKLEGPVIGYVGNLSSRIDVGLLEHVATTRPGWNLVLIGSTHLSKDILRLDAYDNVHFLGVKEHAEARRYIRGFDVAMVPHLDDEMTRSMNPLKAFVYLSLNVPVVSTEIENLGELRQMVHVAGDREDFVRKVELALEEERDGELSEEQVELLRRNSWEERVERILGLIKEELSATPDPDTVPAEAGRKPE